MVVAKFRERQEVKKRKFADILCAEVHSKKM
jgi:hypothetical protein